MWYVLHCPKGKEEAIIHSCRQHIPKTILKDAFTLRYRCLKKRQGKWREESKPLFPEYVFLESEETEALSKELEAYRGVTHVLEDRETLWPVKAGEEEILKALCSPQHEMELSRGYIRGGKTCITEGPLKGQEELIQRIDRHKRLAWLKVPMLGREERVKAGLEIYEKET